MKRIQNCPVRESERGGSHYALIFSVDHAIKKRAFRRKEGTLVCIKTKLRLFVCRID